MFEIERIEFELIDDFGEARSLHHDDSEVVVASFVADGTRENTANLEGNPTLFSP